MTDLRTVEGRCRGVHFHRARLHHTGVLICRDFCLDLGRDVGGRVDRRDEVARKASWWFRLRVRLDALPTCGIWRPLGTDRTISRVFRIIFLRFIRLRLQCPKSISHLCGPTRQARRRFRPLIASGGSLSVAQSRSTAVATGSLGKASRIFRYSRAASARFPRSK